MGRRRKIAKNQNGTDDLSYIWPQLRAFAVPLDSIAPDPENVRDHDVFNLKSIEASLKEHGQWQPIIVQKEGMIIRIGNGRYACARKLGWSHIAALVVEKDDVKAVAMAIADNRTAELATWKYDGLGQVLTWLHERQYDIQKVGFSQEELDAIVLNSSWQGIPDEHVGGGKDPDLASIVKIRVGEQLAVDDVRIALRKYCQKQWGDKVEVR